MAEEAVIAQSWSCGICTFVNASAIALACSMCGSPRSEEPLAPPPPPEAATAAAAERPESDVDRDAEYDTDRALALLLQSEERDAYVEAQRESGSSKISVRHRDPEWRGRSAAMVSEILSGAPIAHPQSRSSASDIELHRLTLDADICDVADDEVVLARLRDGDPHVGKHDAVVWGRRHARNIEEMAPDTSGAMLRDGVVLPNKVYNSLRTHYKKGFRKGVSTRGRVEQASRATRGGSIDQRTASTLFSMTQSGKLTRVDGVLRSGKEASVHHAVGPPKEEEEEEEVRSPAADAAPAEGNAAATPDDAPRVRAGGLLAGAASVDEPSVTALAAAPLRRSPAAALRRGDAGNVTLSYAVKIYRTTVQEFRNRAEYMDGDHRFRRERVRTNDKFKLITMWAEKEFANLHRMHRCGMQCPTPV